MSADNWAICPRCARRHDARVANLRKAADDAYGRVSVEEWKAKDHAVKAAETTSVGHTLREDYDFSGAEEGTVVATYGGSCSRCGLNLSFKHEVAFEGVDE